MASPSDLPSSWDKLNNSKLVRYLLLAGLGWVIVQVLAYFEFVLVVFIFAAIIAFLLSYPVRWLSRFMPHWLAAVTVFVVSLVISAALAATLGLAIASQGQQLLNQAPQFLDQAITSLDGLQALLGRWNIQLDLTLIEQRIRDQALGIISFGANTLQQGVFGFLNLMIIAIIALFMLLDGGRLWHFIIRVFPPHLRQDITRSMRKNFLGFFAGRLLLAIIATATVFVLFVLLGVPFPLALAAIVGVFDLIPGIGAVLGITIVCLLLLPLGVLWSLQVLVVCIVVEQIEENLLLPRVMQGSVDINPVVIFFALLVGARVAGILGVFLSIPIAGVLVNLLALEELRGSHGARPIDAP